MDLYDYTILPIEFILKTGYLSLSSCFNDYSAALIILSAIVYFLTHPLTLWAEKIQAEERQINYILQPKLQEIKKKYTGIEKQYAIERLYDKYSYHPIMSIRSALGLLLQIPFLIAAYNMLSNLEEIKDISCGPIHDLSNPDGLIFGINLLPFLMTLINFFSILTVRNFTKREIIQSCIISLFFLILLYNAPSALLIYWTCNNVWSLLGNYSENILKRNYLKLIINSIKDILVLPFALFFSIFLLIPLDTYFTNINELWFNLNELSRWLLAFSLYPSIVLIILFKFLEAVDLRFNTKFYYVCWTFIFSLFIMSYMQVYVLNTDYGFLDGSLYDRWDCYQLYGIINSIEWILGIITIFYLQRKCLFKNFQLMCTAISVIVCIMQIFNIIYTYRTHNNITLSGHTATLTTDKMFTFAPQDNIIVFLLDNFDTSLMKNILEHDSNLMKEFSGFTYYPDATSVFSHTFFSVPNILTGKEFEYNMNYNEYLNKTWKDEKFFNYLKENDYTVEFYTHNWLVNDYMPADNLIHDTPILDCRNVIAFTYMNIFKILPHFFKKGFIVYSGYVTMVHKYVNSGSTYTVLNDADNYWSIFNKQHVNTNGSAKNNAFKFYHLNGAHPPYHLGKDLIYHEEFLTQQECAEASIIIVSETLKEMKEQGLYNNATIAVIGDHGDFFQAYHGPVIMIKQPGAVGELTISNNPVSHKNFLATIARRFEGAPVEGIPFDVYNNEKRVMYVDRRQGRYQKYIISPDMSDKNNWHLEDECSYSGISIGY